MYIYISHILQSSRKCIYYGRNESIKNGKVKYISPLIIFLRSKIHSNIHIINREVPLDVQYKILSVVEGKVLWKKNGSVAVCIGSRRDAEEEGREPRTAPQH